MKRWTEYCTELYNHPVTGDTTVLKVFNENQETPLPILRSEIETAVNSLKKGKSPGVDNIPAELILAGDNKLLMSSQPFATLYGRTENGQRHGLNH